MRVLVACEFSGVVRDAFRALGHDAWSCDLLPADDGDPHHYQQDVLDGRGVWPHLLDGDWDLMIAHPPCTWLCRAMWTNAARKDRPKITEVYERERDKAFEFVMALYNAPIPRVAIENPIGYLNSKWRKPDCIVRPFMFGHPYKKDICLWLKNLPALQPTSALYAPGPYKTFDFWSSKRNPNGRSIKSITFRGVAEAMAQQWGSPVPTLDTIVTNP